MDLPGVLRDSVDAVVSRGYETIRDRLLADSNGTNLVDAVRNEIRSDVERIMIFTVLLRIQAD